MRDKHKGDTETRSPRSGRPPIAIDIEKARKQKALDELDKKEDLEVGEGSEATKGNPESPDNTGAERKVAGQESEFDDAGNDGENDPAAIDEEMRNQDS